MDRRSWLASVGTLSLPAKPQLPLRAEFPVTSSGVSLNNARWHPLSRGARRAVEAYLAYKTSGGGSEPDFAGRVQAEAKQLFARLIHATPEEIAFVPSTLAGENFVVSSLGLPARGGKVVTDALHFEGSLYLYGELARQGLQVEVVRPRAWGISLEDLDRAITPGTRLVALSQVSMMNGFQHDLRAVCELAHSRGALVFADIVQAAGAVPVDVRATGVDFCSTSSYKWLMGDMGLGFLYVRRDRLGTAVQRPHYGYRQLSRMDYHLFPHDPPGASVFEYEKVETAGGYFELGTVSNTTVAALSYSLRLLLDVGVERIQAHRQPLLRRLQKELPARGFEPLTPPGSTSPIAAFSTDRDTEPLARRLRSAGVDIAIYPHRIRISPSLYNDGADIDRLLDALS
jgi:selenocysteine lyase/cysteine desulfurase